MKSIALSIMMMLPFLAWGEGLESLGKIAKEQMNVTNHKGMTPAGIMTLYNIEPKNQLAGDQPIITKIAISENGLPKNSQDAIIVLKKVDGFNDKYGINTSTEAS